MRLLLVLGLASTVTGVACGSDDDGTPDSGAVDAAPPDAAPDAAVAPVFRNPVDMPDEELATAVLARLGAPIAGAPKSCDHCHGMTRQSIRQWRALSDQAQTACLTDLEVTDPAAARTMIDCMRIDPANPNSVFAAVKLGVYTTAAELPWFTYLFNLAYGAEGPTEHAKFVQRVRMPREQPPLDQAEFDLVAEYFARGLPLLDAVLPIDPPPTVCTAGVSADVAVHVSEMALSGWSAVNAENDILMHGCGVASTPRDCLADEPRVAEWESLAGTVVRSLATVDYASAYWTRSSADGRFVAHGRDSGDGAFVDLQDNDRVIPANAFYDPGFFPDNSGFAFQSFDAFFCEQDVLAAGPAEITFNEPGCSSNNQVGLYQHLGAALGGGDYWTVDSQFVSDNGGHVATLSDPPAAFSSNARSSLTPMIHDGNQFEPGDTVEVDTRYEGDSVLSPSARLLITRVTGPDDRQLGFVLHRIDATPTPGGYQIEVPEIARYCVNGGKPGFSFDERWLAYHHYVGEEDAVELGFSGPNDPAFAPYLSQGASNVYVLDILTGETQRVTGMGPGEYALYPHFRSDGWIYFLVRGAGAGETIAATDAALVLAE